MGRGRRGGGLVGADFYFYFFLADLGMVLVRSFGRRFPFFVLFLFSILFLESKHFSHRSYNHTFPISFKKHYK